jgi:hypothetical protein
MKILWIVLAAAVAFSTGRNVIAWALATYFFGVFALIPLVFLSTKKAKLEERQDFVRDKVEQHLVKQEFKGVNNVEDLFNQLEKK